MRWTERPELTDPILLAAFEGWNDAGDAATTAAEELARLSDARTVATIDPEPFYDFAVNRPEIGFDEDGRRVIEWPSTDVRVGRLPGASRDVVLVTGSEPRLRWRTFARTILAVAEELGAETIITFGALLADVVHSDPVGVIGSAVDPDLVARLGLRTSTYEGPTGIIGVLQLEATEAGFDAVSLWAPVPTYVAAAPSPKAAVALLDRVANLYDLDLDLMRIRAAASGYVGKVDELVAADTDLQDYVQQIREAEADEPLTDDPARSSNELMMELEEYLRDQER